MDEPHKSLLESVLIQNKPISKVALELNESLVAVKNKFKAARIKLDRFKNELANAKTSYITEDKLFRQKISAIRTGRFFASLNKFILGKMDFY